MSDITAKQVIISYLKSSINKDLGYWDIVVGAQALGKEAGKMFSYTTLDRTFRTVKEDVAHLRNLRLQVKERTVKNYKIFTPIRVGMSPKPQIKDEPIDLFGDSPEIIDSFAS